MYLRASLGNSTTRSSALIVRDGLSKLTSTPGITDSICVTRRPVSTAAVRSNSRRGERELREKFPSGPFSK